MPPSIPTDYKIWNRISYKPVLADKIGHRTVKRVTQGMTVLDIGCNKGDSCIYLAAERGARCTGIDINSEALAVARQESTRLPVSIRPAFEYADIVSLDTTGRSYDLVLMSRFLTCLPDPQIWRKALAKAKAMVKPGGLFYVYDFFYTPHYEAYHARYGEDGLGVSNFWVKKGTKVPFIAHHHTDEEVEEIKSGLEKVYFDMGDSKSMTGNACLMFEFLGSKPAPR